MKTISSKITILLIVCLQIACTEEPHNPLDTTFGSNGIVIAGPGGNSEGYSVAIQADGKIIRSSFAFVNAKIVFLFFYNYLFLL